MNPVIDTFNEMLSRQLNPDIKCLTDYSTPANQPQLTCDFCGEVIPEGKKYLEHNGTIIDESCLDDMPAKLLIEILQMSMEVA